MSTILDALKKLEEEKNTLDGNELAVYDAAAERDLVGRSLWDGLSRISLGPAALAVGGVAFVLVIVGVAAGTAMLVAGAREPLAVETAAVPVAPAPVELAAASPISAAPTEEARPAPVTPASAEAPAPVPAPAESLNAVTPAPMPTLVSRPVASPQLPPRPAERPAADPQTPLVRADREVLSADAAIDSAPAPQAVASVAPAWTPPAATEAASDPAEAPPAEGETGLPTDLATLPRLSYEVKEQFGWLDMKVNMPAPQNARNPRAYAVITFPSLGTKRLQKLFVGERIPNSPATLAGVDARGIAIQVQPSGKAYYESF